MDGITERGFAMYVDMTLPDDGYVGKTFTVQQSSLATEHRVWVGMDLHRAHLSVDEAIRVRDGLSEFIETVTGVGTSASISAATVAELMEALGQLHRVHTFTDVHGRGGVAGAAMTPHCAWQCNVVGEHDGARARFNVAAKVVNEALAASGVDDE